MGANQTRGLPGTYKPISKEIRTQLLGNYTKFKTQIDNFSATDSSFKAQLLKQFEVQNGFMKQIISSNVENEVINKITQVSQIQNNILDCVNLIKSNGSDIKASNHDDIVSLQNSINQVSELLLKNINETKNNKVQIQDDYEGRFTALLKEFETFLNDIQKHRVDENNKVLVEIKGEHKKLFTAVQAVLKQTQHSHNVTLKQMKSLQDTVTTHKDHIDAKITSVKEELTQTLQQNKSEIVNTLNNVNENINNVNANINSVNENITKVNTTINNVNDSVNITNGNVLSVANSINNVSGTINEVSSKLDQTNSSMTEQIDKVKTRMNEVELNIRNHIRAQTDVVLQSQNYIAREAGKNKTNFNVNELEASISKVIQPSLSGADVENILTRVLAQNNHDELVEKLASQQHSYIEEQRKIMEQFQECIPVLIIDEITKHISKMRAASPAPEPFTSVTKTPPVLSKTGPKLGLRKALLISKDYDFDTIKSQLEIKGFSQILSLKDYDAQKVRSALKWMINDSPVENFMEENETIVPNNVYFHYVGVRTNLLAIPCGEEQGITDAELGSICKHISKGFGVFDTDGNAFEAAWKFTDQGVIQKPEFMIDNESDFLVISPECSYDYKPGELTFELINQGHLFNKRYDVIDHLVNNKQKPIYFSMNRCPAFENYVV